MIEVNQRDEIGVLLFKNCHCSLQKKTSKYAQAPVQSPLKKNERNYEQHGHEVKLYSN